MKPHNHSEVKVAELNLKIVKIQDIVNKILTDRSIPEGRDIIAFIGPTKAGKSTLINCLMGNSLICKVDDDSEDISIEVARGCVGGPVIGASGESETSVPTGYSNLPGTQYQMWDFPGFSDNKGTEQEIANAVIFERVFRTQKSVRFVLLVPDDFIKSANPMPFFKILVEIDLICPEWEKSLCIIATKAERGTIDGKLKKLLKSSFPNASKETSKLVEMAKLMIHKVIKRKFCIDFKAPLMESGVKKSEFFLPNVKNIVSLINDLKGTTIGEIPMLISDQAKSEIQQLSILYNDKLTTEVNEFCETIQNFIHRQINDVWKSKGNQSGVTLSILKEGQKRISDITNAPTCSELINEMKKLGIYFPTLAENMSKFYFIENIQNKYKIENKDNLKSEKQFFQTILITLRAIIMKYSDLIRQCQIYIDEEIKQETVHNAKMAREKAANQKQLELIKGAMAREKVQNENKHKSLLKEMAREKELHRNWEKEINKERAWEKAESDKLVKKITEEREKDLAASEKLLLTSNLEKAAARQKYEKQQEINNKERELEKENYDKYIKQLESVREKEIQDHKSFQNAIAIERQTEKNKNEKYLKEMEAKRQNEIKENESYIRQLEKERQNEKEQNERCQWEMNAEMEIEREKSVIIQQQFNEEMGRIMKNNKSSEHRLRTLLEVERKENQMREAELLEELEEERYNEQAGLEEMRHNMLKERSQYDKYMVEMNKKVDALQGDVKAYQGMLNERDESVRAMKIQAENARLQENARQKRTEQANQDRINTLLLLSMYGKK